MKKKYNSPEINAYKIQAETILAGSNIGFSSTQQDNNNALSRRSTFADFEEEEEW